MKENWGEVTKASLVQIINVYFHNAEKLEK